MAYYNNAQEDDEQDNSQGMNATATPAAPTAPVQLSNQSAVASTGTAPQAPKAAKPASSGAAPAFQSYTKANQGTAQNKLNNAATSAVANAGQTANTAIKQSVDQFGNKVEAGSLANRQQALQDVSKTIASTRSATAVPAPAAPAPALATPGTTASAAPATPAPLDLSQVQGVDRFKEVINAQYQGPESLRQSGLYNQAAAKVDSAANMINNSKTAAGREEMLKNMYAKRADYTSGLNKLDSALLNSNKQGVQALQNTAQAQGDLKQSLDKAQVNSANLATNRTTEINDIRNQSKELFNTEKKAEEAATEARMDAMVKTPLKNVDGTPILKVDGTPMTQWDQLTEQLRDTVRNKGTNNEAALKEATAKLGPAPDANALAAAKKAMEGYRYVGSGATRVKVPTATKADQANYQRLLDQSNAYNSQVDALKQQYNPNAVNFGADEAAFLGINAGEGLYDLGADAIKQTTADRTKLISKDEQYRQAALAQLAGLDSSKFLNANLAYTDADAAGTQSIMDSVDLAGTRAGLNEKEKAFQEAALANNITGFGKKKNKTNGKTYTAEDSANLGEVLKSAGYNFNGGQTANSSNADVLNKVRDVSTMSSLNDQKDMVVGSGSAMVDGFTGGDSNTAVGQAGNFIGSAMGANFLTGALGLGGVGDALDNLFGSGANTAASKDKARSNARKDLNNNVQAALDNAGFQNRVNIDNSKVAQDRQDALKALIASFDPTNRKL